MEVKDYNFHNGWFISDFKPNLINSKEFEFEYKKIPKGFKPDYHFHKLKTEFIILNQGKLYLKKLSNN